MARKSQAIQIATHLHHLETRETSIFTQAQACKICIIVSHVDGVMQNVSHATATFLMLEDLAWPGAANRITDGFRQWE